ncbi:class I SAM-dependent methyltransferase [Deinococcus sp. HMF7604]|uniref:class I SAM-dependent methyltransferase n=1 Tax=Deinococcus betulae TaxID=2873312 RepID=UPI001CCA62EE|nr:class I SAM-dependent methyltransferase [Deinococcus betulae]MBZ9751925.1 class I SAM-dependent methyltransferase [Deinococcus betulae]
MPRPVYEEAADFYVAFVDRLLADPESFWHPLLARYDELLGPDLPGARVLDIACGERHLARRLCAFGPASVLGIDLAPALVEVANQRAADPHLTFRVDDAHTLSTVPTASVDIAVSKLALMDIPDHRALFGAAARVLVPGGPFVFSLLHPCFEAPFHEETAPRFVLDEAGERLAYRVQTYQQEGHWQSGGSGVRGRLGAYHRTLSTLVNDLLAAGFLLRGLHELTGGAGLMAQVPQTLLIDAQAQG